MSDIYDRIQQAARNHEKLKQRARPAPVGPVLESIPGLLPASRDAPDSTTSSAEQVAQRVDFLRHNKIDPAAAENLARAWVQPRATGTDGKPRSRRERAPAALKNLDPDVRLGLERVIGLDDTLPIAFLRRAANVARAVGRIGRPQGAGGIRPDGTGFLVSNALLVTNEHVLANSTEAARRVVEFEYEEDEDGNARLAQSFKLEPSRFFLVSKELDVAIVAVAPGNDAGASLASYGVIRLRDQSDAIADGVGVVLIQHPRGERKRIALRENEIDYLDDTWVHYQADTDPGSSGSPVLDMNLDLIALHHAGVPRIDDQGRVLTTDGALWDRVDPNRVAWISNEGIRIEKIVAWLQGQRTSLSEESRALLDAALQGTVQLPAHLAEPLPRPPGRELVPQGTNAKPASTSPPSESTVKRSAPVKARETAPASQPLEMRWVIPLEVTVRVLPPTHATGAATAVSTQVSAGRGVPGATEALTFDPDYRNRAGYDPDWLDGVSVPFPKLTAAQRKLASWDRDRPDDADRHVLRYHHFSVVHHRTRRLPWVTAVNTTRDPELMGEDTREEQGGDRWIRDPRIPDAEQITDRELYRATDFDLGHLVMRKDAYWGDDEDFAKRANADTFHYTNCTPQHWKFNRAGGIWGALEAHIGRELKSKVPSLSIFAGPVLADDDPEFQGVQIPRRYWKVVAGLDDTGALAAFGFVLSQEELLRDMGVEAFSPGRFEVYQVPIKDIEELTGLALPKVLRDADQGPEAEESVEAFRPLKRRAKR